MMDTTPYTINYWYKDQLANAEIRPCCKEDNVVDYAIWENDKLAFTVTKITDAPQGKKWVIALKNSDHLVEDELVQLIGTEIDLKTASS